MEKALAIFDETRYQKLHAIAQAEVDRIRKELAEHEEEAQLYKDLLSLVQSLLKSWGAEDPGKDKEACWFLTKDGERCVARELLPIEIPIFDNYDEWREWTHKRMNTKGVYVPVNGWAAVPPSFKVIPFAKVQFVLCPEKDCGLHHPVIEMYAQTDDGPEGDTWRKRQIVLCNNEIVDIGKPKFSENRF